VTSLLSSGLAVPRALITSSIDLASNAALFHWDCDCAWAGNRPAEARAAATAALCARTSRRVGMGSSPGDRRTRATIVAPKARHPLRGCAYASDRLGTCAKGRPTAGTGLDRDGLRPPL